MQIKNPEDVCYNNAIASNFFGQFEIHGPKDIATD